MTSPLLPYANAYLVVTSQGTPQVENGRVVTTAGVKYVVQCYLKRQDGSGTTTGADYLPTQSNPGTGFPGVSGDVYLYRGYALRYAALPTGFVDTDAIPTSLAWTTLGSTPVPVWMANGARVQHRQGAEQAKYGMIERGSGKYGGTNIDEIVSQNIGGVPIVLRSGDVIN